MFKELTMNMDLFRDFKWDFKSEIEINDQILKIKALPCSDYFVDLSDGKKSLNAPYYHIETNKDFTLRAKVSNSFKSVYDACALMVMSDETCWDKFCFEFTDIGTHAVVSVVTNGVSDDANGVDIQGNSVYLQIAKKGKLFALHYSLDGNGYKMARYFKLPVKETFKVGFVAQSPLGEGGDCLFEDVQLIYGSPEDLRKGK
jgi:regulation of enolase protein 1 (concanavalin A-like superfamily)